MCGIYEESDRGVLNAPLFWKHKLLLEKQGENTNHKLISLAHRSQALIYTKHLSHVITDYGIKPDWIGDNATVTMYMAIYIECWNCDDCTTSLVSWNHSYSVE